MEKLINILLNSKEKSIAINEKFVVKKIEMRNDIDLIILDLQQNSELYEGIVMIKGLTFPLPNINDIILAKKMYLKYSKEFQLKLHIEGEIILESYISSKPKKKISFAYINMFNTLSGISKVTLPKINSMIFMVEEIEKNIAHIKSISNSEIYYLQLKNQKFKLKNFIWIYYYELSDHNILLNKLSTIEILDEEGVLKILETLHFENVKLFQIIDINNDNIILINSNGILFSLKNDNENFKFDFCTTIIISNYNVKNNNMIELTEKSFVYKFDKKSYYYENVLVNSFSVLEITFLDFKEDENIYDCFFCEEIQLFQSDLINEIKGENTLNKEQNVKILAEECEIKDEKTKKITKQKKEKEIIIIENKIHYIVVSCLNIKHYEYYPFNITLFNTKKEIIESISFTIYLFPGLMNKINGFINVKSPKTYFYEFLYYNLDYKLENVKKNVIVEGKEYTLEIYDSFGSENRKRICALNIPHQKSEISEDELNTNSIQVCELIKDDIHKIIGIYNISNEFYDEEILNDKFDVYYPIFGNIFDLFVKYNEIERSNMIITLLNKVNYFNTLEFDIHLEKACEFSDIMTLSQFKVRFGLIICKYISICGKALLKTIVNEILSLWNKIKDNNLSFSEIIRILIFTLNTKYVEKLSNIELIFVSELNHDSPYYIAHQFNIDQINDLNEFSPLFQAYLQLDSYKPFNYIHQRESYTFSMELIFMMKYQLLKAYENFFFIKREESDEYAYLDTNTQITTINEFMIFGKNFIFEEAIKDKNTAKNYAMPISINFMHEKSGHYKYRLKNHDFFEPLFYYKGLKIQTELSFLKNEVIGESGKIIHNFIFGNNTIIENILTNFIFGEFLSKEYFGERNFNKLITGITKKIYDQINRPKSIDKKDNDDDDNKTDNKIMPEKEKYHEHSDLKFDVDEHKKHLQYCKKQRENKFMNNMMYKKKKMDEKRKNIKNMKNE